MGTKPFPKQAKAVRAALNLSQEELAHAPGVSFATVNRWENRKTAPSKLAQRQFEQFCEDKRKKGCSGTLPYGDIGRRKNVTPAQF